MNAGLKPGRDVGHWRRAAESSIGGSSAPLASVIANLIGRVEPRRRSDGTQPARRGLSEQKPINEREIEMLRLFDAITLAACLYAIAPAQASPPKVYREPTSYCAYDIGPDLVPEAINN